MGVTPSSTIFAPFPTDSVSLSLLHSNLNVISSSSVIPQVGHGFMTNSKDPISINSNSCHPPAPSHDTGPLTRSRKRKLFEGDKAGGGGSSLSKTKSHRTGTIVIE